MTMTQSAVAAPARRDVTVMSLIGVAHAFSHFYQLVLPPLFPILKDAFGVSYAELGLMMTLFYVASGACQPPAGFLVDRFGARKVLFSGIALLAGATMLMGLVPSFWMLLPLVVLAGIGNSVFHPADYSILTASVSEGRIGRAYSLHTLGGNIGWAAGPAAVLPLAALLDWRWALIIVGAAGLVMLGVLVAWRGALSEDGTSRQRAAAAKPDAPKAAAAAQLAPLFTAPVLMCFAYFTLLSLSLVGLQGFLPPTLQALHGTPIAVGGTALTAFLLGGSAGILVGGTLADRSQRHDLLVAGGLLGAAALIVVIGLVPMSAAAMIALIATAGFLSGSTMPSRDMIVRGAAPRGATGRVFGFVYSGLDAGSSVGPLAIGLMLDSQHPIYVIWLVAACMAVATLTVMSIRRASAAVPAPAE